MAVQKARKTVKAQEVAPVAEPMVLYVGDKVLVDHVSDGNGKLVRARETVERVSAVYLDGTVRIGNGDVYTVVASGDGRAKWKTVFPKKGALAA